MRTIYGPIFTLRPYKRGIQEKLGRYHMFILPGLGFQILFQKDLGGRIDRIETVDKMTNRQIAAKVRQHFQL